MNQKHCFRIIAILLLLTLLSTSPYIGLLPFWAGAPIWIISGILALIVFSQDVAWRSFHFIEGACMAAILFLFGILSLCIVALPPREERIVCD